MSDEAKEGDMKRKAWQAHCEKWGKASQRDKNFDAECGSYGLHWSEGYDDAINALFAGLPDPAAAIGEMNRRLKIIESTSDAAQRDESCTPGVGGALCGIRDEARKLLQLLEEPKNVNRPNT